MKSKLSMKLLGIVVTIATLASLLVGITVAPVSADAPGALAWTTTDTPSNVNNVLGGVNYTVTPKAIIGNPDINLMAASPDGKAIFAWDDAHQALYKSADGVNWGTSVGINTTGVAVGLEVSPNFATDNAVALATPTQIWLSTDGGATFTMVAGPASGIRCFDLGYWYTTGNVLTILVGSVNGVSYLKWSAGSAWTAVPNATTAPATDGVAGNPVFAVKFSNNALTDGEIMAVYYDTLATGTMLRLSSCFGTLGWGIPAYPDKTIYTGVAPTTATIALASDYVANTGASIIVGVAGSGGTDGIYRVYGRASNAGSVTADLLVQPIASLAVSGPIATATVYAGVVGSSSVYKSTNITTSSVTFTTAGVTGNTAMLAVAGGLVYAGTIGVDSAVSVSADGGVSFQQVGLIDVGPLTGGGLLPVALVNFTTVDANTMFVVMSDSATNEQFVFKTTTAGVSWMRVYTSLVPVVPFSLQVAVSQKYATDSVVAITDGTPVIQKSTNGGSSWSPVGTAAVAVTALWVTDGNNIFVGASTGGVFKLGVFTLSTGLPASPVFSFALSPKDATNATLMVGLVNGAVYESINNGVSFAQVGTAAPGGANAYVAYGPDGTRYAASTAGGVFDYLTGTGWTVTVAAGAGALVSATGVAVATGGTLYASDATATDSVFRTLNPTATTPTVNQMNFGGSGFTAITGTAIDLNVVSGAAANNVYIIDSGFTTTTSYLYAGRIRGFSDTMSAAPAITAPKTGTLLTTTTSAALSWPAVTGATDYQISIDGNAWTSVGNVTSYTVSGAAAPYNANPATFNQGETHTWSVRVDAVNTSAAVGSFYSMASAAASFILALVPPPVNVVQNPTQGATNVAVDTTFTWPASPVAGATYEFVIAEGGDVNTPAAPFAIIDYSATALTNATALKETLKYDTQYYWEVRTVTGTSKSAWTVSFFTTEPVPTTTTSTATVPPVTVTNTSIVITQTQTTLTYTNPPSTQAPPAIPSYLLWAVIAVGAILVIAVIVLIVRTRKI